MDLNEAKLLQDQARSLVKLERFSWIDQQAEELVQAFDRNDQKHMFDSIRMIARLDHPKKYKICRVYDNSETLTQS